MREKPTEVKLVAVSTGDERHDSEVGLFTALIVLVCGLGCASMVPAVERFLNTLVACLVMGGLVVWLVCWVVREVPWYLEDRAAERAARAREALPRVPVGTRGER